ncbi:MAG TPA: heme-copper oxidase subunit III [Candidatus Binataceae bacterium]|jgi:cytochrome c oxidase subunit 3/cytochrome o ubiquinol oxidase subunit 3
MASAAATSIPTPALEAQVMPPRGRVGILALILTETAFFSIFVAAYIFYIGKSLGPPYPRDVLSAPIVNTICLLSSSATIVFAVRALRMGNTRLFGMWWLVTLLLGLEFLTGTALEWHRLIYREHFTISTNLFGTTYYSLVGLHAIHVTVGLIMILIVMLLTAGGHVSRRYAEHTELLSWYWHFVDAVWVVVFTTVYVIGR